MELSEKQIKDLKKFSKLLNSLNMEDGVIWYYQCYDGYFEKLYGPIHGGKNVSDEVSFLPESIEEFFETIRDNFDTGNFYSDYYETESGTLTFTIFAERNEIDVTYDYYVVNNEESRIKKDFYFFSNMTPNWRGNEREAKKLSDTAIVEQLKYVYGESCSCSYDGGGDSGWVDDDVRCSKGRLKLNEQLESICYDLLDLYYGGWEINEGSNGSIDFNFEDQIVDLYHNQNVEESVDEHYMTLKF